MTDEQLALLAAIRSNPDDDLVRMVYADWVEEQGDSALAELIRCHVERERVEPHSQQYDRLLAHSAFLLAMNRERWTAELRERFGVTAVEFVRGIPEEVTLTMQSFVAHSESLFATFPIRHLRFTDVASVDEAYRASVPLHVRRSIAVPSPVTWEPPDGYDDHWFELLDTAPPQMESHLRHGAWSILCFAVWSGPDRETARRYYSAFRADPIRVTNFRERNLAVRPFNDPTEFVCWCPVSTPEAGPHWIELANGQMVHHRRGIELPEWITRYQDDGYEYGRED